MTVEFTPPPNNDVAAYMLSEDPKRKKLRGIFKAALRTIAITGIVAGGLILSEGLDSETFLTLTTILGGGLLAVSIGFNSVVDQIADFAFMGKYLKNMENMNANALEEMQIRAYFWSKGNKTKASLINHPNQLVSDLAEDSLRNYLSSKNKIDLFEKASMRAAEGFEGNIKELVASLDEKKSKKNPKDPVVKLRRQHKTLLNGLKTVINQLPVEEQAEFISTLQNINTTTKTNLNLLDQAKNMLEFNDSQEHYYQVEDRVKDNIAEMNRLFKAVNDYLETENSIDNTPVVDRLKSVAYAKDSLKNKENKLN